jgi:heme oxygenase
VSTLSDIDIMDEHDAFIDTIIDKPLTYEALERALESETYALHACRDALEDCEAELDAAHVRIAELESKTEDPSPMCNCGTCSPGNYTCIRSD